MTIGSILLGVSLFLIVLAFLARPFFVSSEQQELNYLSLLDEKEQILDQVKRLEFEFETEKIPPESYNAQRSDLIRRAAQILQQFETAVSSNQNQSLDAKIEAAVAQLQDRTPVITKACLQCGSAVGVDDKFCANCGHQLNNEAS